MRVRRFRLVPVGKVGIDGLARVGALAAPRAAGLDHAIAEAPGVARVRIVFGDVRTGGRVRVGSSLRCSGCGHRRVVDGILDGILDQGGCEDRAAGRCRG